MSEPNAQVVVVAPGQVEVNAPLTFQTAHDICQAGIQCIERDHSPVITVDCAGVTRADSAGLAVLIEWRRWALHRGCHVKFANLPEQISAIARLSEVTAVLSDAAA